MKATLRKRSVLQLRRNTKTGISHVIKFSHHIITLIWLLGSLHINPPEYNWMAFASSVSCPTDHLLRNSWTPKLSSGTILNQDCHWTRSLEISLTVFFCTNYFPTCFKVSLITSISKGSGPEGPQRTRSQVSSASLWPWSSFRYRTSITYSEIK